jgi:DNA mismatch repair ATPase MutS
VLVIRLSATTLAGNMSKFLYATIRKQLENALQNGEVLPYNVYQSCLRMDGQTLVNLEVFSNSFDGGSSGMGAPSTYILR